MLFWEGSLRSTFSLHFLNILLQSQTIPSAMGKHVYNRSDQGNLTVHKCSLYTTVFGLLLYFSFDLVGFRQAQTMAFAVDEINRNSQLLPNISLGYSLYDSCGKLGISFRAALSMTSGRGEPFQLNQSCYRNPPVLGIVGDSSSTRTIAVSSMVSLYRVPMVSCHLICSIK